MNTFVPILESSLLRAEAFDDQALQAIFARSEVEVAQLGSAEFIFEPSEPVAKASLPSVTESSLEMKKWWLPFSSKKGMIQLAPILVVVIAMHRPEKVNDVRVVNSTPVHHFQTASVGEYVQPAVRYPVLMKAIERGRLAEATRPDPRNRRLRNTAEPESLTEAQQVAFGRLGDPPADHTRRLRLP